MARPLKKSGSADIFARRGDFPILRQPMNGKPLAYLDSAASAQKPQAVIDAMRLAMETQYANVHRGVYALSQATTTAFEAVRGKVARFINAPEEREIVFTRSATEAINLVAYSWGRTFLKAGDEIILSGMEHHANLVPWLMLAERFGITLKFIPVRDDGTLDLDTYNTLFSPRTRLVACVHVSNALGTVNPVAAIAARAKAYNGKIRVLIDGSQAVVHGPVDVQAIDCDFYVFTGHKLYGPTGVGVLWGRYDVLAAMPPWQGGGDMIERVTQTGVTFREPPARFEAGTPAILEVLGLGAAIDYVSAIGMAAIAAHEAALLAYGTEKLAAIAGLRIVGTAPHKAGILSMVADWGSPSDLGMILDRCGVAVRTGHHCCQPLMQRFGIEATVRASLGLYSERKTI